MINLKDYNVVNGVATPKNKGKKEIPAQKKLNARAKVIGKDDLGGKDD